MVEVVIIAKSSAGKEQALSGGYLLVPLVDLLVPVGANKKVAPGKEYELREGSPRDLITRAEGDYNNNGGKIAIKLFESKYFDSLKSLVPENSLISSDDIVPGIQGNHIPKNVTPTTKGPEPAPMIDFYLHKLRLQG